MDQITHSDLLSSLVSALRAGQSAQAFARGVSGVRLHCDGILQTPVTTASEYLGPRVVVDLDPAWKAQLDENHLECRRITVFLDPESAEAWRKYVAGDRVSFSCDLEARGPFACLRLDPSKTHKIQVKLSCRNGILDYTDPAQSVSKRLRPMKESHPRQLARGSGETPPADETPRMNWKSRQLERFLDVECVLNGIALNDGMIREFWRTIESQVRSQTSLEIRHVEASFAFDTGELTCSIAFSEQRQDVVVNLVTREAEWWNYLDRKLPSNWSSDRQTQFDLQVWRVLLQPLDETTMDNFFNALTSSGCHEIRCTLDRSSVLDYVWSSPTDQDRSAAVTTDRQP